MANWNFKYNDKSKAQSNYNKAVNQYNNYVNQNNGLVNSAMTDVNAYFDQLMNYGDFSYDMNKDALFQMYKQQYARQGNAAMTNAMGVGAAINGGYNSSNAQTAAQTVWGNYQDALSQKAVETYQNAYDMYNTNFNKTKTLFDTAQSNAQNRIDNYYAQQNALANQVNATRSAYEDERNYQLNAYNNKMNYGLQKKKLNG